MRIAPRPGEMIDIDRKMWEAESPSDDEGYVYQESFIAKAEVRINEVTGEPAGPVDGTRARH